MTAAPRVPGYAPGAAGGGVTDALADPAGPRVEFEGLVYPAEELARGAAYELRCAGPAPGFRPMGAGGAARWHRFVHVSDITAVYGAAGGPTDDPLCMPVSRNRTWADVQRLSQRPATAEEPLTAAIRRTATVRRGSRMVKVLSAYQAGGYLRGWLPAGFCHREYDVAHLRTPDELRLLRTDAGSPGEPTDLAFVLRWRAVDGSDYEIPTAERHPGLVGMPAHDRVSSPVLGTGFTPSARHVLPEFVTTDMADLPLPAHTTLLAYLADGTEVVLYTYQPEQRGWLRMAGPRWRHLLYGLDGVNPEQEYLPVADNAGTNTSRLVGRFRGEEYDTVADPPVEFRVRAMTRAARYPVESLARRTRFASWRGVRCAVVRDDGAWVRVRLCRPDPDAVAALATRCYERGIYEAWAPAGELTARETVDLNYPL